MAQLARELGGDALEVVAYQHLPVFHTEHCVFCRFLSTGTSYKDCGRPCEKHEVSPALTSAGRAHPVMADVGCRNTVFGAEAQQASAHLDDWRAVGIHRFRLEFAHESGEQVTRITRAFADTLAGRRTTRELAQRLQSLAPQGVTQGSLYVPEGYLRYPSAVIGHHLGCDLKGRSAKMRSADRVGQTQGVRPTKDTESRAHRHFRSSDSAWNCASGLSRA